MSEVESYVVVGKKPVFRIVEKEDGYLLAIESNGEAVDYVKFTINDDTLANWFETKEFLVSMLEANGWLVNDDDTVEMPVHGIEMVKVEKPN